jgi:acyl-CoA reductase-like NAD-dependent aldehyde dehydrogenase
VASQALWIAGQSFSGTEALSVENPYTDEVIAEVPLCGAAEVERACQAAERALLRRDFPAWKRAEVLDRAAEVLRTRIDSFAATIVSEAGKPIALARGEVARCMETLRFAAAEARTASGELIPMEATRVGEGKVGMAMRVPIGVVAAITPFNFPLNLVAHKLAPAIAAGAPVVLKPAPQAPLSAIRFVELLFEVGLPQDWVSVLCDRNAEAAAPLVKNSIPELISFTGSAGVGHQIAKAAAPRKVCLELGSNAPVIVMPEVDCHEIAPRLMAAACAYAGQSCIAVQRIIVHKRLADELAEALVAARGELVVGDPMDENTQVGPMISKSECTRVLEWIESSGGDVLAGGTAAGAVCDPSLVRQVSKESKLWREEVFGPVAVLSVCEDFEDAIAQANDSRFGLHVGVFTRDVNQALRAARELNFGGVLVNEVPTYRSDLQPYGGVGDSGNTLEGPHHAMLEMTRLRFVSLQGYP